MKGPLNGSELWNDFPHVYETQQFSAHTLDRLCEHACSIEETLRSQKSIPRWSTEKARTLVLLFFQASTRTYATFLRAGKTLGCDIPTYADPSHFSSSVKGESLLDAIAALTAVGGMESLRMGDCAVIRHPEIGAPEEVAKAFSRARATWDNGLFSLPVINAGDGKEGVQGQHPTQALVDLATIFMESRHRLTDDRHPLDGVTMVFSGDLRGRTVQSLLHLLGRYGGHHPMRLIFSCNSDLRPKQGIEEYLHEHDLTFEYESSFPKAAREADFIYMTRIQEKGIAVQSEYVLTPELLDSLRPDVRVMHPLPIDRSKPPAEIDNALTLPAIAGDPRCAWFRQSHRGWPVRTALLDAIFAGQEL